MQKPLTNYQFSNYYFYDFRRYIFVSLQIGGWFKVELDSQTRGSSCLTCNDKFRNRNRKSTKFSSSSWINSFQKSHFGRRVSQTSKEAFQEWSRHQKSYLHIHGSKFYQLFIMIIPPWFLEHCNSQKSVSNIWQSFSCLLDEGILKIWKKLNSHDGFLTYLQNSTTYSAHFCPALVCPQKATVRIKFLSYF